MLVGIAGYTAEPRDNGILLTRSYAGIDDTCIAKSFGEAVDFLLQEYPRTIHIVYDLSAFVNTLLRLVTDDTREMISKNTKAFVNTDSGSIKVFSIRGRMLGLTKDTEVRAENGGAMNKRQENVFYQLIHWLPGEADEPQSAGEVARLGEAVVDGLEKLGLYPDKLTSPVRAFTDAELSGKKLPTIFSCPENQLGAMNYAAEIMRYEWRSAYRLGYFDKAWGYDITAAYPSIMAELPNTNLSGCQYSPSYIKSDWGIMKGIVEVTAPVSPIIFDTESGYINPAGKWPTVLTTEEAFWLDKHKAGHFKMIDGYFWRWATHKPYQETMRKLWDSRQTDDAMVANLSKKIAQGISGKLDQDNQDGSLGEFYNPVLAAITRSRCRLKVADFIYDYDLVDSLIAVQVDSVLSTKKANLDDSMAIMGVWREDYEGSALVLGKGEVWRDGKKPLAIAYDAILEAFRTEPDVSYYEFDGGRRFIDLLLSAHDVDREYDNYPKTGGEALSTISGSRPLVIKQETRQGTILGGSDDKPMVNYSKVEKGA